MAAVMVSMGWKRLRLGWRLVLAPADCTRRPASRGPDTGAAELGLTRIEIMALTFTKIEFSQSQRGPSPSIG